MSSRSLVQKFSLMSAGLMLLAASVGAAQTPPAKPQAPAASTDKVTLTATVEAIDRTNRTLMLKGPKGNVVELAVDPSFKRFDELNVGDQITATYYESIAASIRRPGDPAPKPVDAAITPRQGAPGATASVQQTVSVVVQSVDKANRSVTVKKADGGIVSFRVENPKYLEMAKPGETVDITYTRALLLEANPAKK
jgi:hypothetical protein